MKKKVALLVGLLLSLGCSLSWADVPGFMKERMGTMKGTVYAKDKAMADAIVAFFDKSGGPPPIVGSARRVPDMVGRADAKGEFSVKLLPGTYYVGTMLRKSDKGVGPPQPGEEIFFAKGDKGQLREFVIEPKQVVEVGRVDGMPPGEFQELKTFTTITGKVSGEDGKPLAGVFVTLKDKPESVRPKYVSEPTDKDGVYTIKVPPGKYFVMARETIKGNRPSIGTYVGSYGKADPLSGGENLPPKAGNQAGASPAARGMQGGAGDGVAVEGKDGEVKKDINIQMFKIPDPDATREKFEQEAGKSAAAQPPAAPAKGK